jgi:mannosyltransferase
VAALPARVAASVSVDLSPPDRVAVAPLSVARAGRRVPTEVLLVAGLTLVGAALRFATITSQSFWFDESQAVHEMRLSFGAMLHLWSAYEPNPPLYFVLAWPWAKLFGTGEMGIRSLSALLGTITVPLVYLCGRELVSRRAGLFAAAFAALNPFLIWYSQEAREYMLLTALSAASVLFFARTWNDRGRRDVVWWAIFSALALATQYFAGFLVAAEALALLYRARDRITLAAVGLQVVVQAALIGHLLGHISHPKGWIDLASLSVRIRQVPVALAFNTLYKGPSALSYSLLGAALVTGLLIALLVGGATGAELRGAGMAAALAGAVLLVPLGLALVGHDYYEARALIPGWIPLAVVVGAACAAPGTRVVGAGLAVVLCAAFVYANIKIDSGSSSYRRPDWRGVAAALGPASTTRAIVAYDGTFATAPLAIYLPGVPWTGGAQDPQVGVTPITVGELDVVGDQGQSLATSLPSGTRLISARQDDGYLIDRFALAHPVSLTPAALGARAARLLSPAPADPPVLIQYPSR